MKNISMFIKILIPVLILSLCLRVYALDAECDYSITTSAGELKYKVVIEDYDTTTLKGGRVYVRMYNYTKGKYVRFRKACTEGSKSKDPYKTGAGIKVCILTVSGDAEQFVKNGLSSDNKFSCPTVYQRKDTRNSLISITTSEEEAKDGDEGTESNTTELDFSNINLDISDEDMECSEILGSSLTGIVHLCITLLRIAGAIITLVQATLTLLPAITSDDAGALKKALKKCVSLAIILVVIGLFPTLLNVIGKLGNFDLTCLA